MKITLKHDMGLGAHRVMRDGKCVAIFSFSRTTTTRGGRINIRCSGRLTDQATGEHEDLSRFAWFTDVRKHVIDRYGPNGCADIENREYLEHAAKNGGISPTGRLVKNEPPVQNIPIRTPEGKQVRETLVQACSETLEDVGPDAAVPSQPVEPWSEPKVERPFIPSPQQRAVFDWVQNGRGNAFVEAVAGAGKTTTLLEACRLMKPRKPEFTWQTVAFCAYNAKIAKEIKAKVADRIARGEDLSYVRAGTFHSFGFAAWKKVYPGVKFGPEATREKGERMLSILQVPEPLHAIVTKLVSFAKNDAVMLNWQMTDREHWGRLVRHYSLDDEIEDPRDLEVAIDFAVRGLEWSRSVAHEIIDFDDMIWMVITTDVQIWQHNWILVDEAQDTNPSRRALAAKMRSPIRDRVTKEIQPGRFWTRMVWVGDRHQAIYGFTGANNDAVDLIIRDFQCRSLPLTVTYRCPKSVVLEARQHVDHIQAHESAPQGLVRSLNGPQFEEGIPTMRPTDAILCRKTAPLISMAFKFIKRGVAVHVEGKEIGKGLASLANKYKTNSIDTWRNKLENFRDKAVARLTKQKKHVQAEGISDRVESLLVLSEGCHDVGCVIRKIDMMFADATFPDGTPNPAVKKTVTFATVHRAKGLEWDRVFILGYREYMPLRSARQTWEREQEVNLIYVAQTRAQRELVYLPAFEEKRNRSME